MKRQLYWLLITALLSISSIVFGKQNTYPTMTENGKTYYLYNVQKSEGLYAISQRFSVPQALIIEANPGIEQGLKLGQQIKVPKTEASNKKATTPVIASKNQHIVKAKETLYGISKKYNCTVDELLALNPWATNLTIGAVLQIPANQDNKEVESTEESKVDTPKTTAANKEKKNIWSWFKKTEPATTTTDSVPNQEEVAEQDAAPVVAKQAESHIKVAVLLPFMLDSINRDASMDRFVDFYQGCLIAADSLANNGLVTEFYTFDTGKDAESIQDVLNEPALANVNLIIGPAYQSQVNDVAVYAAKHKIPTIIPFATNVPDIHKNPYLFEVVTPQKELYGKLIEKCTHLFIDKHILLVQPKMLAQHNKVEFTNMLLESMNTHAISYQILSDEQLTLELDSIAGLHADKECIVVMPSTHGVALNKLGEALHQAQAKNIAVFGFPEWNNLGIEELYNKTMYQFSSYYTSFSDAQTIAFYQQLKDKFGLPKSTQQSPNFALFGFDICYFFMQQYQTNGKHFYYHMPQTETNGLQMNFLFEQVENGGHWNVGTILKQINKNGIADL